MDKINCKGSWIKSAKNIYYIGKNKLECELKNKKGKWIKNKLIFRSNDVYINVDGKFILDKKLIKYQHNKSIIITMDNFWYIQEYKKQLLYNLCKLMFDIGISYTISHGSLIEYERGNKIYHDDDIDIRYNILDIEKWNEYCKKYEKNNNKYNLLLDDRYKDISKQRFSGLQIRLIKFENKLNIHEYPDIDIHIDFTPNFAERNKKNNIYSFKRIWPPYDINFNNLRKIKYLNVNTFAPSYNDTLMVLSKQYGENYLIPDKIYNNPPWKNNNNNKTVITFGTYDLFHIGHLNILINSKKMFKNSRLIVGVSTDNLNIKKKNKKPVFSESDRLNIIKNIKHVDECFFEESLDLKLKYCIDFCVDVLVMGDDHLGKFDFLKEYEIDVIYLPRTKNISTSEIIKEINN